MPRQYTRRHLMAITFLVISFTFYFENLRYVFSQDTPTEQPPPTIELPTETPLPIPTVTLQPTPAPTSTSTETPTDIPTVAPTSTDTSIPTLTQQTTETATSIATETSIVEGTTEATSEATIEETPSVTPTSTEAGAALNLPLLTADQFDAPNLRMWLLNVGPYITPSENGKALHVTGVDNFLPLSQGGISDLVIQARFMITKGIATLGVRHSASGGYLVTLNADGQVTLSRSDKQLATAAATTAVAGQWRTIRLAVVGNVISVTIDGTEVVNVLDTAPLPPGTTYIAGDSTGSSDFLVDDFSIQGTIVEPPQLLLVDSNVRAASAKPLNSPSHSVAAQTGTTTLNNVAFTSNRSGNYDIWTMDSNGANLASRTSNAAFDINPALSTDGRIAFISDRGGNFDLYTMNLDGTGLVQRTSTSSGESSPDWSPNNTEITFVRSGEIIVKPLISGTERDLTAGADYSDTPSWSPNGLRIAFTSDRTPDTTIQFDIYAIDAANGANLTRLTTAGADALDWSPNGGEIVFFNFDPAHTGLSVITSGGTFARQLTTSSVDRNPSWSPDKSLITFHRSREIYKVSATGGSATNITNIAASDLDPTSGASCPVFQLPASLQLRIQPSIYDGTPNNWVFVVAGGTLPKNASTVNTGESWLWQDVITPTPSPLPTGITINSIEAIGFVGIIPWVHATSPWLQIRVHAVNGSSVYIFKGYVQQSAVSVKSPCVASNLPLPPHDPGLPVVIPVQFNLSPRMPLFNGNQAPAGMGSCGLHVGANNPCSPNDGGTTLDVVPRNIELCIDSQPLSLLNTCDPTASTGVRVPVFAPVGGCATFDATTHAIEINPDRVDHSTNPPTCESGASNGDHEVILTHVVNKMGTTQKIVNAGDLVGEICRNSEKSTCGITGSNPTHLAFQLRLFPPGPINGNLTDVRREVLGFLAIPYCVYDNWRDNHATPTRQSTTAPYPFQACPS